MGDLVDGDGGLTVKFNALVCRVMNEMLGFLHILGGSEIHLGLMDPEANSNFKRLRSGSRE